MGWKKDGSGLNVKRIRGMTVSQYEANLWNGSPLGKVRTRRRYGPGRRCDVAYWKRNRKEVRRGLGS